MSIVVPCYNEAQRLDTAAFREFAARNGDVSFLFVDDGSTDATGSVLTDLCASDAEHFAMLTLETNSGKAEAVRRGVGHAFDGSAGLVGYWDADLSTPLEEIVAFRRVLDERPRVIAVLGSRVRRLGADIQRRTLRHYLGRVFATAASIVLRLPVYDTQCGAKLFRATDESRTAFASPFISRWVFDVELLARLIAAAGGHEVAAAVVYEHPLPVWTDVAGSKLKGHHMVAALLDLFRIQRRYS